MVSTSSAYKRGVTVTLRVPLMGFTQTLEREPSRVAMMHGQKWRVQLREELVSCAKGNWPSPTERDTRSQ
jgi:hypothetical protein